MVRCAVTRRVRGLGPGWCLGGIRKDEEPVTVPRRLADRYCPSGGSTQSDACLVSGGGDAQSEMQDKMAATIGRYGMRFK